MVTWSKKADHSAFFSSQLSSSASSKNSSDYETGKAYPRIDKAYKIAAVLDCKVDDLYIKKEPTPNE
nr:helix-turn-helix transcriptional regulator [Geobacillus vulcani]